MIIHAPENGWNKAKFGGVPKMGVPDLTSILIGFSTINHPAMGISPFMETHIWGWLRWCRDHARCNMLRLAGTVTKEVPTSVNWMVQYQVEYHSTKNWWFIWDWYQIPAIEKFQSSTSTVRPIWGWLLGDLYQASFQWRRHVGSRSNLSEIPIILYYNHIILYIIQKTSLKVVMICPFSPITHHHKIDA